MLMPHDFAPLDHPGTPERPFDDDDGQHDPGPCLPCAVAFALGCILWLLWTPVRWAAGE